MAHSLMQDEEQLEGYAHPTPRLGLRADANGRRVVEMLRAVPNEEQLESAAARVRPLFLKQEAIHYSKVLKAIRVSNRGAKVEEGEKRMDDLAARWKQLDPNSSEPVPVAVLGDWKGERVYQARILLRRLAWAYVYGDVVHMNETHLAMTADFGINRRYCSAVVLVSRALLAVRDTLGEIDVMMNSRDLQGFDETVFTKAVVADPSPIRLGDLRDRFSTPAPSGEVGSTGP